MSRFGDHRRIHPPAQPFAPPSAVPPAMPEQMNGATPAVEPIDQQHHIIVTVRDDVDIDDPSTVAQLSGLGLEVDNLSSFLGIVSGRASDEAVGRLRALDIVVAVEEDGEPTVWLSPEPPQQ
jgi:hypothetical protein